MLRRRCSGCHWLSTDLHTFFIDTTLLLLSLQGLSFILPALPDLATDFFASRHAGERLQCEEYGFDEQPRACQVGRGGPHRTCRPPAIDTPAGPGATPPCPPQGAGSAQRPRVHPPAPPHPWQKPSDYYLPPAVPCVAPPNLPHTHAAGTL